MHKLRGKSLQITIHLYNLYCLIPPTPPEFTNKTGFICKMGSPQKFKKKGSEFRTLWTFPPFYSFFLKTLRGKKTVSAAQTKGGFNVDSVTISWDLTKSTLMLQNRRSRVEYFPKKCGEIIAEISLGLPFVLPPKSWENLAGFFCLSKLMSWRSFGTIWATFKTLMTFHWILIGFVGILMMTCYTPYITGGSWSSPIYKHW